MPTVPRGPASPDMPVPSETDFWMALATMKELGRFSQRLDPTLQGKIEDRRAEGPSGAPDEDLPDIAEEAREAGAKRIRNSAFHPENTYQREFELMKRKRALEHESASTGVQGGSR